MFEISQDHTEVKPKSPIITRKTQEKPKENELNLMQLLEMDPLTPSLILSNNSRKIFYATQLLEHEERMLSKFKSFLEKNHLDVLISQEVYEGNMLALRCLHACAGDFNKAFDKIRSVLLWSHRSISEMPLLHEILVSFM